MSRLLEALEEFLARQRQRGRTPAADAVRGFVIEEGEAEGLLAELVAAWDSLGAQGPEAAPYPADARTDLDGLADSAAHQGVYLPLRHARSAFDLSATEYDALLLALAAELDARFGRLFAYLNDHVGHTRPTLGLALQLAAMQRWQDLPSPLDLLDRPLIRDGLVTIEGDGPWPGRALVVPHEIARRLIADRGGEPASVGFEHLPVEVGLLDRLVLPEPVRSATAVWADEARARPQQWACLLIAGSSGSGRATLAHAAASASGLSLVKLRLDAATFKEDLRAARREARWHQAALLLEVTNAKIAWPTAWNVIGNTQRALLVSLPMDAAEEAAQAAPFDTTLIALDEPDATLRRQLWEKMAPLGIELEPKVVGTLASSFRFNPGRIAQVFRRAQSDLRLHSPGERRLTEGTLHAAARSLGRADMGELAQRLPCPYRPEDLIVPPRVKAELDLALAWVRHQVKVLGEWGFEQRVPFGYGLSALFSGPSGTGKTMAAQVLAKRLGLDIYRVDLSRVVSKYIGETEKNLGQLFDESHRSGTILFFDEADALFGKRSEVKDAHDRYANVEIGYLLQRMEEHDGIVVLATNRKQDMDEAFTRHFDITLSFPMPDEAHRLRIREGMFPGTTAREGELDFRGLARRFELSGGEIRNSVIAAAYLAANDGQPITIRHLKQALIRKQRRSGRVIDEKKSSTRCRDALKNSRFPRHPK